MEKYMILQRNGIEIPCHLSAPDQGDVHRVVLGVHGFGGSAKDSIQTSIAEEMALFHAATVRFDFPAHGDSPMESNDFTLTNCTQCVIAAAQYAKEQFPQVEDLCIFATGFGAYVTLLALDTLLELPGKVKLVIQTPAVLMHETLLSMLRISQQTLRLMDHYTLPTRRPLDISYAFYKELKDHIALTPQSIPILILHGEQDDFIPMEHIQNFRRLNEDAKLVIIPGASHQFLEEGAWDMVLDLTRDWFEFEQVLLTDWI